MKVENACSYILHRRDYRETSLLLELLTRDHGRVSLVAKGAKRKNRQKSTFELFQPYLISWISKSELSTLTDIESDKYSIILSHEQSLVGFYMNEVVLRLLHKDEPHADLYQAYDNALVSMTKGLSLSQVLRYFERDLLQTLGYGLVLEHDIDDGSPITEEQKYYYYFEHGPSLKYDKYKEHIEVSGNTLLLLNAGKLSESVELAQAKELMKFLLTKYLGHKPLASRALFQAYINAKNNNLN